MATPHLARDVTASPRRPGRRPCPDPPSGRHPSGTPSLFSSRLVGVARPAQALMVCRIPEPLRRPRSAHDVIGDVGEDGHDMAPGGIPRAPGRAGEAPLGVGGPAIRVAALVARGPRPLVGAFLLERGVSMRGTATMRTDLTARHRAKWQRRQGHGVRPPRNAPAPSRGAAPLATRDRPGRESSRCGPRPAAGRHWERYAAGRRERHRPA
jgi:hypothetical protein